MQKRVIAWLSVAFMLIFLSACGNAVGTPAGSGIAVVAGENFYGDVVKQIGGSHVSVSSILSDPNVDPHAYEPNFQNGQAITKARLVIENGAGYDAWMDKSLSAVPDTARIVLNAFSIAPHKLPSNEHVWYDIGNMQVIAQSITNALKKLDAADAPSFDANMQTFGQALSQITKKMDDLKAHYAGTPVGMTETIFLYQSTPIGLHVLTPFTFQKAIADSNDPPADAIIAVNNQVSQHKIKVLIYNVQTITPLTTQLQDAATKQHIPLVPVSETMPTGKNYQQWMLAQLTTLEQALAQN